MRTDGCGKPAIKTIPWNEFLVKRQETPEQREERRRNDRERHRKRVAAKKIAELAAWNALSAREKQRADKPRYDADIARKEYAKCVEREVAQRKVREAAFERELEERRVAVERATSAHWRKVGVADLKLRGILAAGPRTHGELKSRVRDERVLRDALSQIGVESVYSPGRGLLIALPPSPTTL